MALAWQPTGSPLVAGVAGSLSYPQMLWQQPQGPQISPRELDNFRDTSIRPSEFCPQASLVYRLASLLQAVPAPFWKMEPFQMPVEAHPVSGIGGHEGVMSIREVERPTQGHTAQRAHLRQKLDGRPGQTDCFMNG